MKARLFALLWICGIASVWLPRSVAQADVRDVLPVVRAHLMAQGATEVSELGQAFLFEGESSVHEVRLARDGCVGFLAFGIGEVRDVDLSLHTRAGQSLAEDLGQQPVAYSRICGAKGLSLFVSATLYAGRGELMVLQVQEGPRGFERLPASVQLAVSVGGRAEQTRAVGAAPEELMLDLRLEQTEKTLATLGYRARGRATALELRAGGVEAGVPLEGQRCYRLVVYVPVSRGVLVEVAAPDPSQRKWEGRSTQDERVEIAMCTEVAGVYRVQLQARPMRGVVILRAFEHEGAAAPEIRALGDERALAWAEANVVAQARGFTLTSLGEAWVEGSVSNSWPVLLRQGVCYAFAVAAHGGSPSVDVRLIGADGVQRARNEGRRGIPLVFTCATRDEEARLVLRARKYDGAVSVWSGESARVSHP